mmetsp:Transcript_105629/g.297141  ORF Transcript_105629/g.297141 Transcript_105629/m.297141 type:complete len:125 (+) Transcript_105629:132-506(+)
MGIGPSLQSWAVGITPEQLVEDAVAKTEVGVRHLRRASAATTDRLGAIPYLEVAERHAEHALQAEQTALRDIQEMGLGYVDKQLVLHSEVAVVLAGLKTTRACQSSCPRVRHGREAERRSSDFI